ncbi:MAG TPA: gamma-glutamyltransferase [Mycobacteriales bacterium]|nr:gamma-glutamyltransferase [Mycobacteriales bacterium]
MADLNGGRVGPKGPVTGAKAVCSSQHHVVTSTMTDVLAGGGNAVDAAIAGCLVQATVQQDMTNHTGTVSFLFWDAKTGESHYLNSMGTIVPGLAPFRRVPGGHGLYAVLGTGGPMAVIPGFMPGMKAMHERFGTRPWAELCAPAIHWAEEGHEVDSFEHLVMAQTVDFFLYTPSGREHFTPNGHLPQVGDRWPKPELAKTLKRLADEGPDYFIEGEWAQHFVARANELGWQITLDHMKQIPPRWDNGLRWKHRDFEILQPSPPERQGVYCALVLGILRHLDVTSYGHYTESPEALYFMTHALRRAAHETGFMNDPEVWSDPTETLMSDDLHAAFAAIIRNSLPKADMTEHIKLTMGPNALSTAGGSASKQPAGSCELSIVDADGNWVQMMNTLQSGGIPGEVVDGVPMVGSHAVTALSAAIAGWHTGGGRMRSVMSNTMVLRDGKPVVSLGSPGNVHCTVPQVLSNIVDYGMSPYDAEDAPRMLPLEDNYVVGVESRLPRDVVDGLAKLGVLVNPLPVYDYHMGSYQMSWRDDDGTLHACTGPRRAGQAAGI